MFDVGFWEITIIGLVALVIVGPERLPGLARTVGLWVGKARRMLTDVKRDIDRELKASELSDVGSIKKDIEDAGKEVQKASESVRKESGTENFKDTFKDVAETGGSIKKQLKEVEHSAKKTAAEVKQESGDSAASDKPQSKPGAKTGSDSAGS